MTFVRAMTSSFAVAAFSAILLMALATDISLGGEGSHVAGHGSVGAIAAARHGRSAPLRVRRSSGGVEGRFRPPGRVAATRIGCGKTQSTVVSRQNRNGCGARQRSDRSRR